MIILSPVGNCTHPDLRLCTNACCKDRWRCQNPCRRDTGAPSWKDPGLLFLYDSHLKNRWNNLLTLQIGTVNSFTLCDAPEGLLSNLQFVPSQLWQDSCRQAMQREFTGCKMWYVKHWRIILTLLQVRFFPLTLTGPAVKLVYSPTIPKKSSASSCLQLKASGKLSEVFSTGIGMLFRPLLNLFFCFGEFSTL